MNGQRKPCILCERNGIAVKMLTGDNRVIAENRSRTELPGEVFPAEEARKLFSDVEAMHRKFNAIAAF